MPRHTALNAAADVTEKFGVHGYQFDLQSDVLTFTATEAGGSVVTTVEFHGSKLDDDSDVKGLLNDPSGKMHGKVTHVDASGRWGKLHMPHGAGLDGADLPTDGPTVMLAELQAFGQDIGVQVAAAHAQAATGQGHAIMDGICFIAGVGAGVWPIGTLIFGPTAVGCAIYYFML